MVSNDEKIINKSEKFSLLNIYSQTQINKLIKTVMNAEKLTFGSLCEIINKLSSSQIFNIMAIKLERLYILKLHLLVKKRLTNLEHLL